MKPKAEMIPRERVLAALNKKPVDKIPWIEGIVQNGIAAKVCKEPIFVDWSVAPDGFPTASGDVLALEQCKVNRILNKANVQFSAFAPIFAGKMKPADDGSPVVVGEGLIRTREDFEKLFKLPDPSDNAFVENAKLFIKNKGDYCACACIRLGIGATLLSMGLEAFAYATADEPELITDIHDMYANWTKAVVPVLEDVGFDLLWAFDDVAFNSGPVFSPEFYNKYILPKERQIVSSFTKPLITHSDGNMNALMDMWITLGQKGIHPVQPDVMDIFDIKKKIRRPFMYRRQRVYGRPRT